MAEHKECKHYEGCCYRNDIGACPNWCAQFKHKDDVRVVRCKDCVYWNRAMTNKKGFLICKASGMEIMANDFCSYGERKEDGKE